MSQDEYDIHPLDRDYSQPTQVQGSKQPVDYHPMLLRAGIISFASGFVLLFVAAIVLSNVSGGWLETLGSQGHQLSMILILIGGVLIILSYRWHQIFHTKPQDHSMRQWKRTWWFAKLVFWNVAAVALLGLAIHLSSLLPATRSIAGIFQGVLTVFCGLMMTIVFTNRGPIRAYAIGAAVALLFNGFTATIFIGNMLTMRGTYGSRTTMSYMMTLAVITVITGLFCGGYACLLDYFNERRERQTKVYGKNRDR